MDELETVEMALYAISDLHLSLSIDKPMDVFGSKWQYYMDRIRTNWMQEVKEEDYILMPGDISWATYLEQSYKDFEYINNLPGIKIISKGNHDYWWSTASKLNQYMKNNNFNNIIFLHNNCICYKDIVICGTRGWNCPGDENFTQQDQKIYLRELQRLELSLRQSMQYEHKAIIVALHYPPVNKNKDMNSGFVELLKKYKVSICVYGHLHGELHKNVLEGEYEEIRYYLVSCDYLNFKPLKLME